MARPASKDPESWKIIQGFIHNREPLLRIGSVRDAEAYLDAALNGAAPDKVQRLVRTYLNVQSRPRGPGPGPGPAPAQPSAKTFPGGAPASPLDPRIYRLMAYADAAHDFGDVIPEDCMPDMVFPKEVADDTFAQEEWEDMFLRTMAAHATLRFGNDRVKNPAHGLDILRVGYPIERRAAVLGKDADTYTRSPEIFMRMYNECIGHAKSAFTQANRLIPVDLWTKREGGDVEIIQLTCIAELLHIVRSCFGSYRKMAVDSDPLLRLLFAIRYLEEAFFRRFRVEGIDMPKEGYRLALTRRLREELRAFYGGMPDQGDPYAWDIVLTDAAIFDGGGAMRYQVDTQHPTGDVFPPWLGYQITLRGARDTKDPSVEMVWRPGPDARPEARTMTYKETEATFGTREIERALDWKYSVPGSTLRTEALRRAAELAVYPTQFLYAIKRARDWAQVEHAARYGTIFFTRDRLAALYAYVRGAPCIFVHEKAFLLPEAFISYRFVLCNWSRVRPTAA